MRLIDVEPVMDSLKKEEQYAHDRVREAPYSGLMVWSMILQEIGAVIHELESQSTVDAVPVIRCMDCKYSQRWYADKCRCFLWSEVGIDVFEDGYCCYAKRRDDETD